ncbi:hypothetical protein TVAG_040700 [Trichomonas vaginalis G3]|uniref:Uncharacterized protein n=1 Tax=Trichomonas vaginalis (strain ATCC PRA-98 / G3) TaxID=412133 RepID=A2EWN2_TRIV3|nr:hypothetical protein TVAGG3_0568830 [Trichomonas vaginalis G3]EAY02920.1 hypothetical protein TVAG_040700 [Trichomonas vaginalis G3]KAI5521766.1 hypothetical protein TVAGG3_0568830 [Trichomonas vaginalis G3]|eukprot:XP_001315143.1 hypothetical protein [Trichomonas vaginalis G3]
MNDEKTFYQRVDQIISSKSMSAQDLQDLYQFLTACSSSSQENQFLGQTYSTIHKELTKEKIKSLFEVIKSTFKTGDPCFHLVLIVVMHLIAQDLPFFVKDILTPLFDSKLDEELLICAYISRQILDPCTGFLKFASHDGKENHDYWGNGSEDLKTEFGVAITKLRSLVFNKGASLLKATTSKDRNGNIFYNVSILANIQNVIVPPNYRVGDFLCGFPRRPEIAINLSTLQDQSIFTQPHKIEPDKISPAIQTWAKMFGFMNSIGAKELKLQMDFASNVVTKDTPCVLFLKLIPFLNISEFPADILRNAIDQLIYSNVEFSSFILILIQSILLIYPDTTNIIFDKLFEFVDQIGTLTVSQLYLLIFSIGRFMEILYCHKVRKLTNEALTKLDSLTLLAFCAPYNGIRDGALRLAFAISRYETGIRENTVYSVFNSSSKQIEQEFVSSIKCFPLISLLHPTDNITAPTVIEVMRCSEELIWQIMLSGLAKQITKSLDQNLIRQFKHDAIKLLETMDSSSFSRRYAINILMNLTIIPVESNDKSTIRIVLDNAAACLSELYPDVIFLFTTCPETMFLPIIETLLHSDDILIQVTATATCGLTWNSQFSKALDNPQFLSLFQTLFRKLTKDVNSFLIDESIKTKDVKKDVSTSIIYNHVVLRDFVLTTYQLLDFLTKKFSSRPKTPFPCFDIITDVEQKELLNMESTFDSLIIIATTEFNDPDNNLHFYTIRTISLWLCCCRLRKSDLMNTNDFIDQLEKFNDVMLLANSLIHQFNDFLPIFLKRSIQENGSLYFDALCIFFRAPHKFATGPTAVLVSQWESIDPEPNEEMQNAMQYLYEEGGNFLAMCFFYLVSNDKKQRDNSFIMLSSIVPLLVAYHDRCQADRLVDLLGTLRNFSTLTMATENVNNLCTKLVEYLSFMTESVIDRYIDAMLSKPTMETDRLFHPILPWINSISLDLENRVVSRNTDFIFLRFSCFSFVEKVLSIFEPMSRKVEDSLGIVIWQSLAKKSSYEFVINALLSLALNSENSQTQPTVAAIIQAFYVADPEKVVDILVKHLSFMYWLHNDIFGGLIVNKVKSDNDDNLSHGRLIFSILLEISRTSAAVILKHLPVLCGFVLIHKCDTLKTIVRKIFTEVQQQLGRKAPQRLEIITHELDNNRVQLATSYYNLMNDFDPNLANEFTLCLLRWALCCGNIKKSTLAVQSYTGLPVNPPEPNIVGLFSRAFWIVTSALSEIDDFNSAVLEINYVAEIAGAFLTMARISDEKGVLTHNPALFWVPAELLKLNFASQSPIFKQSLKALCFYFERKSLFEAISGQNPERNDSNCFVPSVFMRFLAPWHEEIEGFSSLIMNSTVDDLDTSLAIRALCLIAQCGFPALFSRSESWAECCALTLLPWMWMVSTNDYGRAIYVSDENSMFVSTANSLAQYIKDEEVSNALKNMSTFNYITLYNDVKLITEKCGRKMSKEELRSFGNWCCNLLKFGDEMMKIPLYTIVSWLSEEVKDLPDLMPEFIYSAINDQSHEFAPFVSLLKAKVPANIKLEPKEKKEFPQMHIFERIVVCDIPSLYDVNTLGETEVVCEDVNSLVPISPITPAIKDTPTVQRIRSALQRVHFPPFESWAQMSARGAATMLGVTGLSEVRRTKWNAAAVINQALELLANEPPKNEEEEEEEELPDPMGLIPVVASAFIPTMDDVNEIGANLFDEDGEVGEYYE